MDASDREHEAKLRQILLEKKQFLEVKLNLTCNPASAVDTVFNLMVIELELNSPSISVDLTPDEYLKALDQTEAWYISRGYNYPHPEWLKEQKNYWNKKQEDNQKQD